jgi:signal peptidase
MLFAPIPLAGQAAYVIVDGNSMEPGMRRGDLAVVRRAELYQVGDVATYRHPTIGPVIHRIIGRDGERFIFQGDNNSWADSYRPRADELIGKLWLHVPRAGSTLKALRTPPVLLLLVALILWTPTMTTAHLPARARRRAGGSSATQLAPMLSGAFTALILLALLSAALAAVAFARPVLRTVTGELSFTHVGRFDYGAAAPPGLYDGAGARSGDAIFRRVSSSVPVTFTYQLSSAAPADLAVAGRLNLELSDGQGWRRTLPLGAEAEFQGASAVLTGTIDLDAVQRLIDGYEGLTGLGSAQYRLAIAPALNVDGTLGGERFAETYAPRLAFRLDAVRLQLDTADGAPSPLDTQQSLAMAFTREEAAALALGPLKLEVLAARRLGLLGLELALAGLALLAWCAARELQGGEAAAIRLRYGPLLVAASGGDWARGAIELTSIDELARVAERLGAPIIHVAGGAAAGYYVRDAAGVYRYGERAHGAGAEDEAAP